jgi:hypothetical protein
MRDSQGNRLAAGAGVLAAVLLVAGFVLVGVDAAMVDSTRGEVVAAYSDDATNSRQAMGVLLTGLGGICFLPFLSYVRLVLGRIAGDTSPLPGAAFAGGVLLVGGLITGAVLSSAVSAGAYFDAYRVDADLAMTAVATGFYFNGFASMAGGVLIASVAIAAYRTRLLPRWLTVVGLVVAVVSVRRVSWACGSWSRRSGSRSRPACWRDGLRMGSREASACPSRRRHEPGGDEAHQQARSGHASSQVTVAEVVVSLLGGESSSRPDRAAGRTGTRRRRGGRSRRGSHDQASPTDPPVASSLRPVAWPRSPASARAGAAS